MHRFLLHNEEVRDTTDKLVTPGQVGLLNGWGVFSTLRVKQGVLFAWHRHYARMKKDAELMRIPFPQDAEALRASLLRLIAANQAQDATLRVCVVRNKGGMFESPGLDREYDIIAFTKELKDWGASVRLAVKKDARHATSPFSGAKILSWSMNLTWLEEAQSRGFDEMLLLDHVGHVSECTSANIFAVQGGDVWTPPLTSGCLPGVTRAVLLEEVKAPGLRIGERHLILNDLYQADEVFITSSTRDLLPVSAIESRALTSRGDASLQLREAFQRCIDSYVARELSAVN